MKYKKIIVGFYVITQSFNNSGWGITSMVVTFNFSEKNFANVEPINPHPTITISHNLQQTLIRHLKIFDKNIITINKLKIWLKYVVIQIFIFMLYFSTCNT